MEDIFSDGIEAVYVRGDTIPLDDKINFIESGALAVYAIEDDQRSFIFAYKSGDIFEYSRMKSILLSGRSIEFRALSTVTTFSIPKEVFEQRILKSDHGLKIIKHLLEVIELQMERIDNLQVRNVRHRLVVRLLFFAHRLGIVHGDKVIIDAPLSHADIASSIASSRETVNRLMRQLEQTGFVRVKKQIIVINSISKLEDLAKQELEKDKKTLKLQAGVGSLLSHDAFLALPDILSK